MFTEPVGQLRLDAAFEDFRVFRAGEAGAEILVDHADTGSLDRAARAFGRATAEREVNRARLVTGGIAQVGVDVVGNVIGQPRGIGELVVLGLAGLDRIGNAENRWQELQRAQLEQRQGRGGRACCIAANVAGLPAANVAICAGDARATPKAGPIVWAMPAFVAALRSAGRSSPANTSVELTLTEKFLVSWV